MKNLKLYYLVLALLVVVYAILIFNVPIDQQSVQRYGIDTTQARVLSLTVIIPFAAIWYIAFFGFVKLKEYSRLIGDSRDGRALKIISDGLMVLAITLPVNTITSNIVSYLIDNNRSLTASLTIFENYLSLTLTLTGMWLVALGAKRLARTLDKKPYTLNQTVLASVFTAFCIFYTYVTMTDPFREGALIGDNVTGYYLPDFLVFATIVVPYICVWLLGLRAAYHVHSYRKNAPGVLYRKALGFLASGVAFVVLSTMALRLISSLSSLLNTLTLKYLLVLLYALLILIGLGYAQIALGAKKLKKIEEV